MTVTVERADEVLVVHLDDGKANAITVEMCAAVTEAVRAAEADPVVHGLVLHGRPGRFSGGFDLAVMQSGDPAAMGELMAAGAMLAHTLYSSTVPVVAACTGHAVAMGAMLLCACDARVGTEGDFKIGLTEHLIGMPVPEWCLTILAERVPRRLMQRVVMNAEMFAPAHAIAAGFLDSLVHADQVLADAVETADAIGSQIDLNARAVTLRHLRGPMLDRLAAHAEALRRGDVFQR